MTGVASLPGGSVPRAISAAMQASMSRAAEDPVEQPLPDAPALQRVELDGQRVFDLVGVVADADAEPLAQEGADGVAGEADEVLELDEGLLARRQRPCEERRGLRAFGRQRFGAVERDGVEAPRRARA